MTFTLFVAALLSMQSPPAPPPSPPPQQPPPVAKPAKPRLEWQHDWKTACERAALEKKPILVCVLADSEPICQKMFEKVETDELVMKKLAGFVLVVASPSLHELVGDGEAKSCARYRGVLCSEHQAIEVQLRSHFLDAKTGGVVIPQFGVFDAEGKLVLKREYAMKRDGFVEFLTGALAKAGDPGAAPSGEAARSPALLKLVEAILDAKDDAQREQAARDLFSDASPEREWALQEVLTRLKKPADRGVVVRAAGYPEQKGWAPSIAKLLADPDDHVRGCAVVTLEEQRNPAVVDDLLALWKSEKVAEIRKDLLRALGPCGAGSEAARKLLLEEFASGKEPHRIAAAFALGSLLKEPDVAAALQARWPKEANRKVKVAIVWGIGACEDESKAALLEQLAKGQKDDDLVQLAQVAAVRLRSNLKKAIKSLGKGGGQALLRLVAPIYEDDKIVRNALRAVDDDKR